MPFDSEAPKSHYETQLLTQRDDIFRGDLTKILQDISEKNQRAIEIDETPEVRLGQHIDYLSSQGATTREVLLNGKKVGTLVKFETSPDYTSKAMFMNAERSPNLFTMKKYGPGEQAIPNIAAIEKYFADHNATPGNKKRDITMIVNGPTFEAYGDTKMTGIAYDNGVSVGSETKLTDAETKAKGIAYIANGKLTLSHTSELTQDQIERLVAEKRDIFTMSSLKRNGNINPSAALRNHINSHTLVQFTDGTIGELILNNCSPEQKKAVVTSLSEISRALYADADAASNYLDGIRIQTDDGLKYSHPDKGDLFTNPQAKEPAMVENNMPGIIIFYAEEQ